MSEDKTSNPENFVEETPAAGVADATEGQVFAPVPECDVEIDPVEAVVCPGCGAEIETKEVPAFTRIACPACATELDVPAQFGGFRLLRELGSGGMGSVFLGQDDALNRKVAIKVVKRTIGSNPGILEGFQREAQATARLNHPNIVQIYAFGQEKGQPYIAMELVGGGSLDGFIEKKKRLDPAFVLRVGKEIALALGAAQEAGLIHGDVKPENILFDENYRAKLVDFGIASALSADVNAKEIWGTPYYIAPEKAKGKKADIRSDLYSLGATLYHALTLHPPFDGPDARAVVAARFTQTPAPIGKFRPDADRKAIEIIDRMLHPNPMLRFPTIGSLVASIDEFLKTVPEARSGRPVSEASAVRLVPAKGVTTLMTKKVTAAAAPIPSEPSAVAGAASESPRKGGKKIIIAKGKNKVHLSGVSTQGQMPPVEPAAEMEPVALVPDEQVPPGGIPEMVVEGPTEEQRKKKALKVMLITIGVVILLAIAGVVGVFMKLVGGEKSTSRENAARVAEAKQIEQEVESYDKRVSDVAVRIKSMDEEARRLVRDIEKIASDASETQWTVPSLDPVEEILIDPVSPAPVVTAADGSAADTVTGADAAKAAVVETLLAIKDDPAFAEGKNAATRKSLIKFAKDNESLANDPVLIQAVLAIVRDPENLKDSDMMEIAIESALEKAKEALATKVAETEAAAQATPAPSAGLDDAMSAIAPDEGAEDVSSDAEGAIAEDVDAGSVVAEPEVEHEIITKAKALLDAARRIRRCAKEAELRVNRETDMFTPIKGDSITTQQYNERIRFKRTRENDEKALLKLVEACQADLSALRRGKSLLEKDAKKYLAKIAAAKAAADRDAADAAAAVRRAKAEAEKKARIQRDLDAVEELKMGAQEAIKGFDYESAVKQLSAYRGQYAAKEANEALQNAIDRTQRLADFRIFILKDLHENKGLTWGLGTRDIVDADPKAGTITARGGATADISKLTIKQWMGLIDRLIVKREPNRTALTLKQEGDMLFASAIFCVEYGNGNENALKRAEELARAATLKSEMVRLDIPRIAPELKGALEAGDGL